MLTKKVPIWEEKAYEPYDKTVRNYNKSSYAYDMEAVEKAKREGKLWDIDASKIELGKKYGYKEMCDLTGDEYYPTSKHQQDAQFRVWRCFFKFEEVMVIGRRYFVVEEVYDSPRYELYLSKESEKELHGDYTNYIYQVLLMCLYRRDKENDENDFYEFRTTKWNLYKLLGFANDLFFQNYAFPGEYEIVDPNDEECFMKYKEGSLQLQFYKDALTKFDKTLRDALESLHRCKKINYYWDLHVKVGGRWKRADRVEAALVAQAEGETLNDMGYERAMEATLRGRGREYRKLVRERLQRSYGIENYYDEIDVWVIKGNVKSGIVRMYERYTGESVTDGVGLTPQQLCQKENAEKLNELIKQYFYKLNAPRRARENTEWCLEKHSEANRDDVYRRAIEKQNALIKKYIEIDNYITTVVNGPKQIVTPLNMTDEDDESVLLKEINRDEERDRMEGMVIREIRITRKVD